MPDEHALLSPSSSERWITCPASFRASQDLPKSDKGSVWAQEGTVAHALGELELRYAFGKIDAEAYASQKVLWETQATETGITTEQLHEMETHIRGYVALVQERAEEHPLSVVFIEQRVYPGVPECWGTSDVIIVSPEHVESVDLKYGKGIRVNARENSQLRLYALGALALAEMIGDVQHVRSTVYQPRLDHVSTEEMSAADLIAWRDDVVIPAAEEALGQNARFNPTDDACRWCPAAGTCRVRSEKMIAEDFGSQPDLLNEAELASLLPKLKGIRQWVADVEKAALDVAYEQGKELPGYKVVSSGGKRMIPDHTAAIQQLIDSGFPADQVARFSLRGFGELEKIVGGRDEFDRILGDHVARTKGKPSLVPDSDPRPSIDPSQEAAEDFG